MRYDGITYRYVDNESYDIGPNGWRVSGSNEPPKEIEISRNIEIREIDKIEIEIKGSRDQGITRLRKVRDEDISMISRVISRMILVWKDCEIERKGLKATGISDQVKRLESDLNNLRKERMSWSERATNNICVDTLELHRRLAASAAA